MNSSDENHEHRYQRVLIDYCKHQTEEALYQASLLSGDLIGDGLGPDELVALHYECMQVLGNDESLSQVERIRMLNDAHHFLLEVMIAYGAQYKEFLDLKLAEAIRRAENAELGEQEKLEVLGMIAHELGNPLTVALANMHLAIRSLDSRDLENVRELVGESREALERLANLTRQLVAASKDEELTLSLDALDLRRVLARANTLAYRSAEDKGVELNISSPPHPILFYGDEEALVTIVNNLLSNGVRYTPAGGSVTASIEEGADDILIQVEDTGIGMSEEVRSRLFEKFYRGEDARSIEPAGLGMGLHIAERLVRAHHGEIEVRSELGKGTTFRVLLPIQKKGTDDGE